MKREHDLIAELATVKDISPGSVSDFASVNSGFTLSNIVVKKLGKLLAISFVVKRNVDWEAQQTGTICTLKEKYRPAVNSGGASATFRELVAADGTVYARPGSKVNANSGEAYVILYMGK